MRQNPCFKVALVLLLLSSTSWAAQPAPSNDSLWRALMLAPQSTAATGTEAGVGVSPPFLFEAMKATCIANCDKPSTVSCNSSGSCTAVDRDCSVFQRGYVTCGSTVTYCEPDCPPEPDCSQFNYGSCTYSWDAESKCCVAPPPDPETVCPYACF